MNKDFIKIKKGLQTILKIYKLMNIYIKKNEINKIQKASYKVKNLITSLKLDESIIKTKDFKHIKNIFLSLNLESQKIKSLIKDRQNLLDLMLYDDLSISYNSSGDKKKNANKTKNYIV